MNIRAEINRWTHGEDWRTWVAHSVLALGLNELFGPRVAIGFYALREVDQVFYLVVDRKPLHLFDHIMDVVAPTVAVLARERL